MSFNDPDPITCELAVPMSTTVVSRSPYDGCSFPLARKIAFIFVREKKGVKDEDSETGEDIETDEEAETDKETGADGETGADEDIGADEGIGIDPLIAEANIGTFVERIKQMAPPVGEIKVQPANRDNIPNI
ncbi:hypothetical protein H4R27_006634, partial [Coemansia aciculifera]